MSAPGILDTGLTTYLDVVHAMRSFEDRIKSRATAVLTNAQPEVCEAAKLPDLKKRKIEPYKEESGLNCISLGAKLRLEEEDQAGFYLFVVWDQEANEKLPVVAADIWTYHKRTHDTLAKQFSVVGEHVPHPVDRRAANAFRFERKLEAATAECLEKAMVDVLSDWTKLLMESGGLAQVEWR